MERLHLLHRVAQELNEVTYITCLAHSRCLINDSFVSIWLCNLTGPCAQKGPPLVSCFVAAFLKPGILSEQGVLCIESQTISPTLLIGSGSVPWPGRINCAPHSGTSHHLTISWFSLSRTFSLPPHPVAYKRPGSARQHTSLSGLQHLRGVRRRSCLCSF